MKGYYLTMNCTFCVCFAHIIQFYVTAAAAGHYGRPICDSATVACTALSIVVVIDGEIAVDRLHEGNTCS